jgi:hypothetical protein
MTGILPTEVQWRVDKANLSFNFRRGLFERDRGIIEHVITSGLGCVEPFVDSLVVQDVYRRWLEQPMRGTKEAMTLYTVTTLALWLCASGFEGPGGRLTIPTVASPAK